jgi:hypothetical protein
MERSIQYFERYELFQPKGGGAERDTAAALKPVATRVDEWYDSFWDAALKYCEGNIAQAEEFMNTNVFMYYYRIRQKAAYIQWHNDSLKKSAAG